MINTNIHHHHHHHHDDHQPHLKDHLLPPLGLSCACPECIAIIISILITHHHHHFHHHHFNHHHCHLKDHLLPSPRLSCACHPSDSVGRLHLDFLTRMNMMMRVILVMMVMMTF